MSLDKLKILPFYNSYENNIVEEFYDKVFDEATNYDRASAYFDSKVLALYGKGMSRIYNKKGKIRFIFSYDITEDDYIQIKNGYENREHIEKEMLNRISYEEMSLEQRLYFENIAFLIQIGLIDIKIAFTRNGIFHDKFGIIYDENNEIYIRGSNNETLAAIIHSYESFETTCSWNASDNEKYKIKNAQNIFEKLWFNNFNDVIVIDIPEIVKEKIIKYSKNKINEIEPTIYFNKLVLDINEEKKLVCKNFLTPNKIDVRDLVFKVFLKKYLITTTNEKLEFRNDLNYMDIRKIINHIIEYSSDADFELIITDRLNAYLDYMDLKIKDRYSFGIDIKNKEEYLINKVEEFRAIVNKEMFRKLRDMQMWNAFHIVSMIKSANFSVPGAGKTSIVYGAFAYLNSESINKVEKIIMIGPRNSFMSWIDEFYECFKDKKRLKVLNSQDSKYINKNRLFEDLKYNSANCNLILINYEKLISLIDVLKEIIDEKTMLVFDEIHKIKSITGVRAKAALDLCNKAMYKVALTGTPLPNSYKDLYNILRILFTDEYDTFFKFTTGELASADTNEIKAEKINEKIYPFYCRTTKLDLDIPKPNEPKLLISNMNDFERELFINLKKIYKKNILTLYIKLLQASTTPELLLNDITEDDIKSLMYMEDDEPDDGNNILISDFACETEMNNDIKQLIEKVGKTSKYKKGICLIEELCHEEKQVLVWGIFIKTLTNISEDLNKKGITNAIISGKVPQEERDIIIKKFKNKEIQVLITNPHTLAESVSLHKTCHDAIYFEYSFNLTHMLQSRDRINRLGLEPTDYTQYYYLILQNEDDYYNDSIDMKTLKRLNEKEEIMLKSIEGTSLNRIDFNDMDDIREILKNI